MSISERGGNDLGEGGPGVYGVGSSRIVVTVVIVVVDNDRFSVGRVLLYTMLSLLVQLLPEVQVRLLTRTLGGWGASLVRRVTFHVDIGTRNDTAFHQRQAGAHVFLLQQVQGRNL